MISLPFTTVQSSSRAQDDHTPRRASSPLPTTCRLEPVYFRLRFACLKFETEFSIARFK